MHVHAYVYLSLKQWYSHCIQGDNIVFFLPATALKMWEVKVWYLYRWLWYYSSNVISTEKWLENSDCRDYFYNSCPTVLNISVVSKYGM